MNAAHPSIAELISLPFPTAEGRWSHALKISGNPGYTCNRGVILFISGAHAREWGGPDILVNLATDLLEAYSGGAGLAYGGSSFAAAEIASIVDRLDVIVFPDINPDGRDYSQTTYPMWRKNRNPASSGGDPAKVGIDPNRNYDFLWDFPVTFSPAANQNTLASANPASDLFHGTSAFSEAETKNVRWLFERYPRIRAFVDVHSYGGDILYPWGDDENQTTDPSMSLLNPAWDHQRGVSGDTYREYIPPTYLTAVQTAATVMRDAIAGVRGQPYTTEQSFWIPGWPSYPTSGASDDWSFSRHFADPSKTQTYGFVIEFNTTQTFFPTWAQMVDIIADVNAGLVALCSHERPSPIWVVLCWIRQRLFEIWRRVLPPELWGPYGPWTRLSRFVSQLAERVEERFRPGGGR